MDVNYQPATTNVKSLPDRIFRAPRESAQIHYESQGSISGEAVAASAGAPLVLPADVAWPLPRKEALDQTVSARVGDRGSKCLFPPSSLSLQVILSVEQVTHL